MLRLTLLAFLGPHWVLREGLLVHLEDGLLLVHLFEDLVLALELVQLLLVRHDLLPLYFILQLLDISQFLVLVPQLLVDQVHESVLSVRELLDFGLSIFLRRLRDLSLNICHLK